MLTMALDSKHLNFTHEGKTYLLNEQGDAKGSRALKLLGVCPLKAFVCAAKRMRIPSTSVGDLVLYGGRYAPYGFIKPVESVHAGYYHVPGFTKYALSKDDVLINVESGRTHKFCYHGRYLKVAILTDLGKFGLLPLHRAKMLTFKHCGENVCDMQVNHIDSDTLNNDFDNLEWVTPSGNITHYHSFGNEYSPIECLDLKTGKVIIAKNTCDAARRLPVHNTTVEKYLVRPDFVPTESGHMFRFEGDNDRPWPEDYKLALANRTGFSKSVVGFDLITKTLTVYSTLGEAARKIGTCGSAISGLCAHPEPYPFRHTCFRFKDEYDQGVTWPTFTAEELLALQGRNRVVRLIRMVSGDATLVFISYMDASRYFGCTDWAIRTAVHAGEKFRGYEISVRKVR